MIPKEAYISIVNGAQQPQSGSGESLAALGGND